MAYLSHPFVMFGCVVLVMFSSPGEFERSSVKNNKKKLENLLRHFSQDTKIFNLRSKNILGVLLNDTFIKFPLCHQLILSGNKITKIEVNAFRGMSLKLLMLDENKIEVLQNRVFTHNAGLEELYLGSNKIQILSNGLFQNLSVLLDLDLQDNLLFTLKNQTFLGLYSLQRLNLQNNQIKLFDPGAFFHLPAAMFIYLTHNKLPAVKKNMLKGLHKISEIRLGDNQISSVEPGSFKHLSLSAIIDLSSNKLTVISVDNLEGLHNITEISFSKNEIYSIQAFSFKHLSSAKTLDLSKNKLTNISKDTFQGLHSIMEIKLDHNRIQAIEPGAFANLGLNVLSFGSKVSFGLTFNKLTALTWDIFLNQSEKTTINFPPFQLYGLALFGNLQLPCDVNRCWLKELKISVGHAFNPHLGDTCLPFLNKRCQKKQAQHQQQRSLTSNDVYRQCN